MSSDLPKPEDLKWQIEARFEVQKLMIEMYVLYKNNKELPKEHKAAALSDEEKDEWYPINRMIGAAFSLWRSAFLTQASSSRQKIYAHTLEFIGKVLSQNSITFADDHRMCELTITYYNANARYRIERLYGKNPKLLDFPEMAAVARLAELGSGEGMDEKAHWEVLFKALKVCFHEYKKVYAR